MRFEVPQFIEIEDKIFGPFTWKQFVYLCGGVGIAVVLFVVAPFWLFVLLGLPLSGLAALLAFYPVNNRPFSVFLESFFNYYTNTKNYRWHKERSAVYRGKAPTPKTPPAAETSAPPIPNGEKGISSLARKLELEAIQRDTE